MSDKILFYLDNDLKHFFLSHYLQKKIDAEFYAIIDITNNPKKFFEKQKFVDYKKSWFLHDNILPETEIDYDYLESIENKYNLELWKLAINERIFYKFNDFYKFSKIEMLSIIEKECKLFEEVLDTVNPNYVILHEPFFHTDELFYKICKAKGIKILMSYISTFGYKHEISQNSHITDDIQNFNQTISKGRSFNQLEEKFDGNQVNAFIKKLNEVSFGNKMDLVKAGIHFLFKSKNTNVNTHYTYFGRTKIKVLKNTLESILKTSIRKKYIDKNLIKNLNYEQNYIYFPLHIDQERTSLLETPFYTDQITFIKNIAKSLPPKYTLFVKEHPTQSMRHWRNKNWYKEVMNIPNVVLIHPDVSSKKLIKNCSLVITLSGTAALEAAFHQKASITFIDADYTILSSIKHVKSIEELPKSIRDSLKIEVKLDELDRYVSVMNDATFIFNEGDYHEKIVKKFYYGGRTVDVEIFNKDVEEFIIENENIMSEFTNQHIKKIEYWKNN